MIGGMVEHDGHHALAIHLGKTGDNETIAIRTQGLSAETIADAIAELRLMGLGCRTTKPLLHAWASPSRSYAEKDWEYHRAAFEQEFGLEGFPCLEVFHLKPGKGGRSAAHVHRVYLRVDIDGKAVRTSHSAIRQEKISRMSEFMAGERFTSGVFNSTIITRLRLEGRDDVAEAMVRAGLGEKAATKAPSPEERAMTERLHDLAADEVWRRAADAWRRSDNGPAFQAALAESGLRLAMGEKVPVLVSPGGGVHPLLRAINKGGERQKGHPIRKTDIDARLKDMELPDARTIRPVPGFDAGVFAITNLARMPGQDMRQNPGMNVEADRADEANEMNLPIPADPAQLLTREQEAALMDMEAAFHSAAADRARATRHQIETEITHAIAQSRRKEALRLRLQAEKESWSRPGIAVSGWRDAYRAQLAGLPKEYGAYLLWVDRLDASTKRLVLTSGTQVSLTPERAWAERASAESIPIMIAHAREQGWQTVTITGTGQWRQDMARAAVRAGLVVTNTDLAKIVEAERLQMEQEQLLQTWWRCRTAYLSAMPESRAAARTALIDSLAPLAASPDIIAQIGDDRQHRALAADLQVYERLRQQASIRESQTPISGYQKPG